MKKALIALILSLVLNLAFTAVSAEEGDSFEDLTGYEIKFGKIDNISDFFTVFYYPVSPYTPEKIQIEMWNQEIAGNNGIIKSHRKNYLKVKMTEGGKEICFNSDIMNLKDLKRIKAKIISLPKAEPIEDEWQEEPQTTPEPQKTIRDDTLKKQEMQLRLYEIDNKIIYEKESPDGTTAIIEYPFDIAVKSQIKRLQKIGLIIKNFQQTDDFANINTDYKFQKADFFSNWAGVGGTRYAIIYNLSRKGENSTAVTIRVNIEYYRTGNIFQMQSGWWEPATPNNPQQEQSIKDLYRIGITGLVLEIYEDQQAEPPK